MTFIKSYCGATLKVRGLTSDSKWGADKPFSQLLFIIFKKVCVRGGGGGGDAPPPQRALITYLSLYMHS